LGGERGGKRDSLRKGSSAGHLEKSARREESVLYAGT